MRITFEPSTPEPLYQKFTVDTLTNHDTTPELVDTILNALRFAGHDQSNINLAAENYAEDNRTKLMKNDLPTYQLCDPGFMSEYRAQVKRDQIKSVCITIALFVIGLVMFESCAAWDADERPAVNQSK